MVKFLHTADWQIGKAFTGMKPELADQLREARLKTAEQVMEIAREEDVDFVLVAGDLFENEFAERSLRVRIHDALTRDGNPPVFVLAGNHDPIKPESVYHQSPFDRGAENLHIPTEPRGFDLPGGEGVLLTVPLTGKNSRNDPTEQFPDHSTEGIRIGATHGQLRIDGQYSKDAHPISLDAVDQHDLDYLALGDWHTHFKHPDHPNRCRYSGTHEKGKFDDDAGVLLVEIEGPKNEPELEYHETGTYNWKTIEGVDLTPDGAIDQLRDQLDKLETDSTLLQLIPEGTLGENETIAFQNLVENARERFLHVDVKEEHLHEPVAVKTLLHRVGGEELLTGTIADLIRLKTMMDPDAQEEIPEVDANTLDSDELRSILTEVQNIHNGLEGDGTDPQPEDIDRALQEVHNILERGET